MTAFDSVHEASGTTRRSVLRAARSRRLGRSGSRPPRRVRRGVHQRCAVNDAIRASDISTCLLVADRRGDFRQAVGIESAGSKRP